MSRIAIASDLSRDDDAILQEVLMGSDQPGCPLPKPVDAGRIIVDEEGKKESQGLGDLVVALMASPLGSTPASA
jgi:hypothetical protein